MDFRRILKHNFLIFDEEAQDQLHGIDVYEKLVGVMRWQLRWVGYDVLEVSFKPNLMTWFSSICLMMFMLFSGYTIVLHAGDWFQIYEEMLDEHYGVCVFVQVLSSVACIALSLFNFYMTYNIGALTFLIFSFFQLLEFCVLGTILTIKNDQIMRALYDTCWYRLSTEEQKMMAFMLHRSQNAVEMTVGGLALLNMETFVEPDDHFFDENEADSQWLAHPDRNLDSILIVGAA
ncbi:putative odorant receptor 83c [Ochlerotatus camptorhynchus]|uniref:putative odorant receptor 83c n=1 Tax=Ochlerotatus camptorhynchus TaxID=644619 RepID=UPI0031CEACE9